MRREDAFPVLRRFRLIERIFTLNGYSDGLRRRLNGADLGFITQKRISAGKTSGQSRRTGFKHPPNQRADVWQCAKRQLGVDRIGSEAGWR
jgi:hypothetical protein